VLLTTRKIGGINTSAKVGKMVKSCNLGRSLITLGGSIDFSTNKMVSMKVFSPRVGAQGVVEGRE